MLAVLEGSQIERCLIDAAEPLERIVRTFDAVLSNRRR